MSNKQTGTVKWFDNAKGFGFLISENVTEDVFVHYRSILVDGYKTLKEGQVVEFLLTRGDKGYQAAEVVPVVGGVAA